MKLDKMPNLILVALMTLIAPLLLLSFLSGSVIDGVLLISLMSAAVLASAPNARVQVMGFTILSIAMLMFGWISAQNAGPRAPIYIGGFSVGAVLFGIAAFAAEKKRGQDRSG